MKALRWVVVVLLMPVLYVASFGPACWTVARLRLPAGIINYGYGPLLASLDYVSGPVRRSILRYGEFGAKDQIDWYCTIRGTHYSFANH